MKKLLEMMMSLFALKLFPQNSNGTRKWDSWKESIKIKQRNWGSDPDATCNMFMHIKHSPQVNHLTEDLCNELLAQWEEETSFRELFNKRCDGSYFEGNGNLIWNGENWSVEAIQEVRQFQFIQVRHKYCYFNGDQKRGTRSSKFVSSICNCDCSSKT